MCFLFNFNIVAFPHFISFHPNKWILFFFFPLSDVILFESSIKCMQNVSLQINCDTYTKKIFYLIFKCFFFVFFHNFISFLFAHFEVFEKFIDFFCLFVWYFNTPDQKMLQLRSVKFSLVFTFCLLYFYITMFWLIYKQIRKKKLKIFLSQHKTFFFSFLHNIYVG